MKIVIDTNVIISGIFFGGSPAKIISYISDGILTLVLSELIIEEYKDVCSRFLKKNNSEISSIFKIIDTLVQDSEVVNPGIIETPYCEDPDDVVFLRVAMASQAKYLISGDKHLLKVKTYPGGKIIKPAQFLEIIKS